MPRPRRLISSTSPLSRRAVYFESHLSSSLPEALNVLLPSCSKPCLRAFIANNYSRSNATNINTLCTINTTSGFTLGEAALICESSYCAADGQVDKSIFSICANVPQAIRPTHDSITVVPMATSRLTSGSNAFSSALPPKIGAPSAISIDDTMIATATGAPSVPLTPNPVPAPSTSSTFASSETFSASPSTSTPQTASTTTPPGESDAIITASSSPTVSSAASQAQGSLNTGQIVGISLAAIAVFGFVVGLLIFLCYRRRRGSRSRRDSRWSDAIEKQPPSPFSPADHHIEAGFSNPRAATPDHSQRFYAPPTTTQEKRRSFWRKSIKAEDIGVAVSPEIVQAGSPLSNSSQRTISQLLPELPNYSLWPAPLRKSQQNLGTPEQRRELARPSITFPSTFMEHNKGGKPPRVVSSRTGNGLPSDPRAQMYKLNQATSANDRIPLTPVYDNGNVPITFGAFLPRRENGFLHPGYAPQPQQLLQQQSQPQRNQYPNLQPPILNHSPGAAQNSRLLPPPPAQVPAHSRTTNPPPSRRNSSSSDSTNIEDDEEPTPESEIDKQLKPARLSPVLESPRRFPSSPIERLTTPLRDLTYPSPPRAAAISKQAEKPSRPRLAQPVNASSSRPLPSAAPSSSSSSTRALPIPPQNAQLRYLPPITPPRQRAESPSSSSSLLAKRRGDKTADQMLQRGLRLSSSAANAHPSAPRAVMLGDQRGQLKYGDDARYQRKGSDTENAVNMYRGVMKTPPPKGSGGGGLKSPPVWTPRLTPTRRGEDLFLRVD